MRRTPSRVAPAARLSDAELPSLDDVTEPWPGEYVEVAGTRLYVRATPAGSPDAEPALLVHGLGGSATNWTDYAGLLRDRLASEAIDLPGFGRSGAPAGGSYSLQAQADTVIAYLDRSGRGPVHLISNSMGGAISILVAAQRPELVRTLTLISPAVPDRKLRAHPLRSDWRLGLLVVPYLGELALRRMGRVPVETRVRATIAMCFADRSRLPERRLTEMVDEGRARLDLPWADNAMLRATRGLVRSQFLHGRQGWATMRRITAPTLVLWGDTDRLVAADLAPFVAAAIPRSRLLVLDDIGHTAMMEDPVTSARATLALLEDCAADAADSRS